MNNLEIRKATKQDLQEIVDLLASDKLGQLREDNRTPLSKHYLDAFQAIQQDPNQELMVGVDDEGSVIATLQLSFIPYLTYQGGMRAQIEAVRVKASHRAMGIGKKVFEWAIQRSKERGAHLVQLTTDKQRPDAIRFYESLGFQPSHVGMKRFLHPRPKPQ